MKVWIIVLSLNGTGKDIEVPPIYYETKEECVVAAQEAGRDMPSWVCLEGRLIAPHTND